MKWNNPIIKLKWKMVHFNWSKMKEILFIFIWKTCKEKLGMIKPMNKMEVHIGEYMEYWGGSKVLIC